MKNIRKILKEVLNIWLKNKSKSLTHLTRIVVKIVVLKGEENVEIMMEQNLFRWNWVLIFRKFHKENKLYLAGHFVVKRQNMKDEERLLESNRDKSLSKRKQLSWKQSSSPLEELRPEESKFKPQLSEGGERERWSRIPDVPLCFCMCKFSHSYTMPHVQTSTCDVFKRKNQKV